MKQHRTAIIDVGGGFRSVYGAGVLDRLMDLHINVDHCYGVSAGSANLSSFLAGQPGRCYRFYTEYSTRRDYASPGNYIRGHNFANLDYIYGTLSNHDGEYPLDFEALKNNPSELTVVATNGNDGSATYFTKNDLHQDDYGALKASSSVPVANQPYEIDGVPYFDGGIIDPIPVQKAIDDGADRIVLILTRQRDFYRSLKPDAIPARLLSRSYPQIAERLEKRYEVYNSELDLAHSYEQEGKVLIVAPDDLCGLNTLKHNLKGSERMYRKGYADAAVIPEFLEH